MMANGGRPYSFVRTPVVYLAERMALSWDWRETVKREKVKGKELQLEAWIGKCGNFVAHLSKSQAGLIYGTVTLMDGKRELARQSVRSGNWNDAKLDCEKWRLEIATAME